MKILEYIGAVWGGLTVGVLAFFITLYFVRKPRRLRCGSLEDLDRLADSC